MVRHLISWAVHNPLVALLMAGAPVAGFVPESVAKRLLQAGAFRR